MSTPKTYRKKPVVIEAMLFDGGTLEMHAVYQWVEKNTQGSFDPYAEELPASGVSIDPATGFMVIVTLEGLMHARPGDYIIRGIQGEFYPCKPDIFEASYEELVANHLLTDGVTDGELTENVLNEVYEERRAQEDKWGQQNHPDGTGPHSIPVGQIVRGPANVETTHYAFGLAQQAKSATDEAAKHGRLTYRDILSEEVFEAYAESDPEKLRKELIQVAAVAVAWVEKLDREK